MEFDVSIVILTKNSEGVVQHLIGALQEQDFPFSCEYIFMDNSSTDGTVQYLESLDLGNKTIVHVPPGEFSHSRTRMQAARVARGRIMVFFTDDVLPIGADFLKKLTAPVRESQAPAAYGVWQIDPGRHDPVDAYLHNDWYKGIQDFSEPIGTYCWEQFTPEVKRRLCNFDNCSSCIRRDILLQLQFPDVPYGEDMLFAKKLIRGGQRVALAKEARFHHWHKVRFSYMARRMCIDSHLGIQEFNIYYVKRMLGVVKAVMVRTLHRTFIAFFKVRMPIHRKFYWSLYHFKLLCADFIGKYMGTLTPERCRGKLSFLKRYLYKKKLQILESIHKNSIRRY